MLVDEFVEKNTWLNGFDYNDLGKFNTYPAFWNKYKNPEVASLQGVYLEICESIGLKGLWFNGANKIWEDDVKVKDYFLDWKRPTKEEQDYFEMVEGFRLPWSEEEPFIYEED